MTARAGRAARLAAIAAVLLTWLVVAAPALAGGSWWHVTSSAAPTILRPGEEGQLLVSATNLGHEDSQGQIVVVDTLPEGVELGAEGVTADYPRGLACSHEQPAKQLVVRCTLSAPVPPYEGIEVTISVKPGAGAHGSLTNLAALESGGATSATASSKLTVEAAATKFGVEKYELVPEGEAGEVEDRAGSHPFQLTTTLSLDKTLEANAITKTKLATLPALPRNLHFTLPPGLLGNVTVVKQCAESDFDTIVEEDTNLCEADTAVGVARVTINEPTAEHRVFTETVPLFNLKPARGEPARFGMEVDKVVIVLTTAVIPSKDYAVEVSVSETAQTVALLASEVTFWGSPASAVHDNSRGWECIGDSHYFGQEACEQSTREYKEEAKAFLTLPTSCASRPETSVTGESWPHGAANEVEKLETPFPYQLPLLSGCEALGGNGEMSFSPKIEVQPDSQSASEPSGLTVTVTVPQEATLSPTQLAEADVKETTIQLPEGLEASPGAANGLEVCSASGDHSVGVDSSLEQSLSGLSEEAVVGALIANDNFSEAEQTCPEASKIGSVKIVTPLLKEPIEGWAYLASQDTNPFRSPLVMYLVANDPTSGIRIKLAGEVRLNQATGQLTSVFKETPPLPFSQLIVHLFGGSRASQSTPALCGAHESSAGFLPWSAEASTAAAETAQAHSSFAITSGPGASACSPGPRSLAPAFEAGSTNTQAGGFTPFTLTINHSDAEQPLSGISVTLPNGVAALLSSMEPCAEPAPGAPWQCGAASLLGNATTVSGLGTSTVTLEGQVYLTQGYDGAPFGLLVATEATAGVFHLGKVYVRSRINVNPETAAVTITTDPGPHGDAFPTFVKGVPVQLKQINVTVNRQNFEFNPTNCTPATVKGTLSGEEGGSAAVSYPFNVSGCASLPFSPTLTASTAGKASKEDGASLNVKITSPGLGQANIAKVFLTIPASLPSRLSTIQKACPEAVFDANPATCDEGSNIGMATVHTPVLKSPLTGPAYLVSHGSAAFPDVEFVLQGEGVTLILDGKTDIKDGVTYSRFEAAPDAPFTSFETELPTGPHSALAAYIPKTPYDLCGSALTMPTEITGQNGAVIKQTTKIAVTGCSGVLASKTKVTKAQLLAKALKACKKYKKKSKRQACEKAARKKYAAKKQPAKKKTSKKK